MAGVVGAKKIYKDIIVAVLLFSIMGCTLFVEQHGYVASNNGGDNKLIDEDAWYKVRNENSSKVAFNAPKCLVLYDDSDDDSTRLMENVAFTLESINVNVDVNKVVVQEIEEDDDSEDEGIKDNTENSYENIESKTAEDNTDTKEPIFLNIPLDKIDDLIICTPSISSIGLDVQSILSWCQNGGHIMFAAGFDDSVDFSEWKNVIGVDTTEETNILIADSLQFNTNLLVGVEGKEFSDDVISCEVYDFTLLEKCILHVSTSDEYGTPLLWEYPIDNGMAIVCNADIMNSKNDRGIVAASYCRFYPVYVYPVINACVYCIDDCPSPIPAGYDKNIISQYGYTISDFYSNVWMPAMQKLAEQYGIKYSTFSIQTYENDVNGPFNNQNNKLSAAYYASMILNMGGEVGIHGYNHQPLVLDGYKFDEENSGYTPWPDVKSMISSLKSAKAYTESLVDELYVESYVAPSNVISNEALQEMLTQMEDIRVYAGVYMGTPDQMIQEFEVLENGCTFCPRLTADMQMEDSEWWTQINELNYHFVESNFIHPDDILDEERSDGGDFNQMLAGYSEMIKWNQKQGLRVSTISECGAAVQRYGNLSYIQQCTNNELKLHVDGLIDTAYLMLRTNGKRPISVEGGKITELNSDIYVLEISKPDVTVKMVDKK